MKYKAVADTPGEEEALASGQFFLPALDLLMPLVQTRAIMAGVRLGIFESLRMGSPSAREISAKLGYDAETVELLLRVLACAGYVTRSAQGYELTDLGRNSMLEGGPLPMHGLARFNYVQWKWFECLEEVVRTGRGINFHQTMSDANDWASYQRAMLEFAHFEGPLAAPLVPVKDGAKRLLDIGGSHGLFGALICRLHPGLRSEVLDLPQAVEHGRKLAREAGIDDVVAHRAGHALQDALGDDYDLIFLASIVHHFSPEQTLNLLRRCKAALTRGGTVAIWEGEQPETSAEPDIVGDGFALFFRILSTSRVYTTAEYSSWLAAAGFEDVQAIRPPLGPGLVLISGRKG